MPEAQYDSSYFEEAIRQHANQRAILIYLGEIDVVKGFEFFTELLIGATHDCDKLAFVAAGTVKHDSANVAERFIKAGGLLIDRHISDCEFSAGLKLADWVWICYRADNDQNSGIFGLAYQAGSRVIVRSGSFVARMATDLEYPTVQVRYGDVKGALNGIRSSRRLKVEKPRREILGMMRSHTRDRLFRYLGIA